jgi:hypothetical protein
MASIRRRKGSADVEAVADRGMGRLAPDRGWGGRGGGSTTYITPPPLWRATSVQACGMWPYAVGAGAPLIGAPLGKHLHTGGTVCADPISWFQPGGLITAPTATVIGREGFGKSSLVRRMALGAAAFGTIPLVLGDLKPDYVVQTKALGGHVASIGRGRGSINPLDTTVTVDAVRRLEQAEPPTDRRAIELLPMLEIQEIPDGARPVELVMAKRHEMVGEMWSDARGKRHAMVAGLCTVQRGGPLQDVEDTILGAALRVLDDHFQDDEPVLADLLAVITDGHDAVREAAYDEGSEERYRDTVRPLVRTLNGLLREEGRIGGMFSRKTTTRLDLDRAGCFDTSSIPADQTQLVAASLMACWQSGFQAVNTRVALGVAGVMPMVHYMIIVDEFWRVIGSSDSGMVDRANELTRLNRQIGAGMVMIYHTIKDLESLRDEHERLKAIGLIERSGLLLVGAVSPDEHARLRRVRDFSDAEMRLLTSWQDPPSWSSSGESASPAGRGKFMAKVGGRPGIPFQVVLTDAERRSGVHNTSALWQHLQTPRVPVSAPPAPEVPAESVG